MVQYPQGPMSGSFQGKGLCVKTKIDFSLKKLSNLCRSDMPPAVFNTKRGKHIFF